MAESFDFEKWVVSHVEDSCDPEDSTGYGFDPVHEIGEVCCVVQGGSDSGSGYGKRIDWEGEGFHAESGFGFGFVGWNAQGGSLGGVASGCWA